MDSFSGQPQPFDFSSLLQTSNNIDSTNHDSRPNSKDNLLFEPTFSSSTITATAAATELTSSVAAVATNMNSFYSEEPLSYETLTNNSNSLQVFDMNSEISQPLFYPGNSSAPNPANKSYFFPSSDNNQYSSPNGGWSYSTPNSFSSFATNDNQKLTIMNNVMDFSHLTTFNNNNNEYQHESNQLNCSLISNQEFKSTPSMSYLTNNFNYAQPLSHTYHHNNSQSSNEIQINNSLSSTPSSSSSISSPSNTNKPELLSLINSDASNQLKTEPLVFQPNDNNFNLLTHFKSETNLQPFSSFQTTNTDYFTTDNINTQAVSFKTEANKSNLLKRKNSDDYSDNGN